LALPSPTSTKL